MKKIVFRGALALLTCSLLLILASLPAQVHADGGAPNLAYVAGSGQGVSIIDIAQQKVIGSFALDGSPRSVYLSPDGRFLYIAQPALDQVSMLAAKTGQIICKAHVQGHPSLLSFDPQTNSLFVAGNQAASISNLDMSNCSVLHTFATSGNVYGLGVVNLASDTANNQLWMADDAGTTIFDTKTRQQIATISLPGTPRYLCMPRGEWVYTSTQQGGLYGIDLTSHHVLPLLSGGQFGTMDFNETTDEVYVPDSLHHLLDVITPPDTGALTPPHEPATTYQLDAAPQSVAITSDGQLGFVALNNGSVAMLDIPGRQLITTINVGGAPQFIITGLYPPVFGTNPQQASTVDTLSTLAAYLFIGLILLVPIWYMYRKNKKRGVVKSGTAPLTGEKRGSS